MIRFAKEAGLSTLAVFWKARLSIIGQGLSFVAMLLPVFLGNFDELRFLVIVATLASVASNIGVWSISSIYPSLSRQEEADLSIGSSLVSLLAICLAAAAIAAASPISETTSRIVVWAIALTTVQAFFIVMTAVAVRAHDYVVITYNRLLFGALSVVTTLVACLFSQAQPSLVAAIMISMLGASLVTAWLKRGFWFASTLRGLRRPAVEWLGYYRAHWSVNLGNLALTLAFQIAAFATVRLGDLANAWAVVVRIVGGFGTTAQQVIAPLFEMHFSKGIREGDLPAARQAQRQAAVTGAAFGVLMAMGAGGALWFSGLTGQVEAASRVALMVATIVYCLALGLPAMIYRNLPLAGGKRLFVGWATAKVIVGGVAFAAFGHMPLLVVLVAVEAVFDPLLLALAFWWLRKRGRSTASSTSGEGNGSLREALNDL